jgi:hypothetical protein
VFGKEEALEHGDDIRRAGARCKPGTSALRCIDIALKDVGLSGRGDAGVGTVIARMLPYVLVPCVVWTLFMAVWYLLGLPWGI